MSFSDKNSTTYFKDSEIFNTKEEVQKGYNLIYPLFKGKDSIDVHTCGRGYECHGHLIQIVKKLKIKNKSIRLYSMREVDLFLQLKKDGFLKL